MTSRNPSPLDRFERIDIINLPHRADRRRAVTRELLALGTQVDGIRTSFFEANRPQNAGGFDTIGTHGCFLSHLSVLQKAQQDNIGSLLILEDDVSFSIKERATIGGVIDMLSASPWDIFYGGSPVAPKGEPLTRLDSDTPALLAHFIAFSRDAIEAAVPYLQAILERPAGSPEGGPMHVDGAYSWLRHANSDLVAFAATPGIAHQRSSATDIHVRRGLDRIPVLRGLLGPARRLKNWWRSRH